MGVDLTGVASWGRNVALGRAAGADVGPPGRDSEFSVLTRGGEKGTEQFGQRNRWLNGLDDRIEEGARRRGGLPPSRVPFSSLT